MRRTAVLGLLALTALPSTALAADPVPATGGLTAGAPAPTAPADDAAPGAAATAPAETPVPSADVPGVGSWRATSSTVVGRPVRITGALRSDLAGTTVTVERRTPAGRWSRATTARVRSTGRFAAAWRTRSTRYHELRLVLPATAAHSGAAERSGAADAGTLRVAVVERGKATWYGPGFYGKKTACGIALGPDTVGVAHRTLPCGTQVEVQMGGKTVVAPVIDRGPFANGAVLDLTKPAADALGVDGVHQVRFLRRDDVARLDTPGRAPAMGR